MSYPFVPHSSPALEWHIPQFLAVPEQFRLNASRPSGANVFVDEAQAANPSTPIKIMNFDIDFPFVPKV